MDLSSLNCIFSLANTVSRINSAISGLQICLKWQVNLKMKHTQTLTSQSNKNLQRKLFLYLNVQNNFKQHQNPK